MNSIPAIMTIAATGLLGLVGGRRTGGRSIPQEPGPQGAGTYPWKIEYELDTWDWHDPEVRLATERQPFLKHPHLVPFLEDVIARTSTAANVPLYGTLDIPINQKIAISVQRAEDERWIDLVRTENVPKIIAAHLRTLPGQLDQPDREVASETFPLKVVMEFPSYRSNLHLHAHADDLRLIQNFLFPYNLRDASDLPPNIRRDTAYLSTRIRRLPSLGLISKNFKIYPEKGYPKKPGARRR